MIIGNFIAFNNLVSNDKIPAFAGLNTCIETLNKICSCQKQRKTQKHTECNRNYINIVNSTIPSLLDYFRSKTSDDEIIFYHDGHNLITKIKLR